MGMDDTAPGDPSDFVPTAEELIANNADYASADHFGELTAPPTRRLAVVACMDARVNVEKILGLRAGEAHIIRNAGGVITDDVIRSLCLSQRYLGTREVIVMHHSDCGLQGITDDEFGAKMRADVGAEPDWSVQGFADVYADTRASMERLAADPFIAATENIRGFVFDVETGILDEVDR